MSKKIEFNEISEETVDTSRRSALSRLGLAASAAYAVPLLMTLSRSAHASDGGDGNGGGDNDGGTNGGTNGGTDGGTDGPTGSSTDGPTEGGTDGISDGSDEPFPEEGSN
jgi:hypothetical protein